jgi:hypothetical protein
MRIAAPGTPDLPTPADTRDVIDALDAKPNVFLVTDAPDPCRGFTVRLLGGRPGSDRSLRTDN